MRRIMQATAVLCLFVIAACGGGSGEGGTEGSSPERARITIIFENSQFEDATVYIDSSTGVRRLGRVEGASTGRFRVNHSPTGFVIEASFQGIGEFETDHIMADPGNTVTIQAQSTGNLVFSIN